MKSLAVLAALFLLAAPKPEQDILWLKDGRKIKGVIVKETEEEVSVVILGKGRKGATAGTAGARYRKDQIARITRMPEDARKKAIAQFEAFKSRGDRREKALEKIQPKPVRFMGREGLRAAGTHFEVWSTCDEGFVKEVAWHLDKVFNAYRESFDVRRNVEKKIRVYLLSDVEDYRKFQLQKFGGFIQNPAFYYPKDNFIAAYNTIRKEEAARIRKSILASERVIKDFKKQVDDREEDIRKQASKLKSEIRREADKAKRKIQNGAYTDKSRRLRLVEKWRREQLASVASQEKAANKKLAAFQKVADAAIEKNRGVIAKNNRVLRDQNRRMFEMLFHEGFHAFTRNFAWKGMTVPRWLDEGLASYYEMAAIDAGELIHGAPHPQFLARVKQAMAAGKPLGIEELLRGGAEQFLVAHRSAADRAHLFYAQSWAIAHYMAGRVSRRKIEAYVTAVAAGIDPVKAFETLMGQPVGAVEVDVRAHVAGLK